MTETPRRSEKRAEITPEGSSARRRRRSRRPASIRGRRPASRRRLVKLRKLFRPWVLLTVVTLTIGLGYVIFYTPLFAVRAITIDGLKSLKQDEVRAAANVADRTPLFQVDTAEVAERVSALPRVYRVQVERDFPSALIITVQERSPVAVFSGADGDQLVDSTGRAYAPVSQPPEKLPLLRVRSAGPDDPAAKAAVEVLAIIPDKLRPEIREIAAEVPGDVRFRLNDGREVRWGSAADSVRKAAVLEALLAQPGKIYNVSSPELPTVA